MKSGYRPFFGVIICVFVPDTASMIRRPHTGQQTGRRVVLSPLVCASFFLRISYTPLSVAAAVRRGRVEYMTCYDCFSYMTSSASHGATGLANRRAFKYAISNVRQVLPK